MVIDSSKKSSRVIYESDPKRPWLKKPKIVIEAKGKDVSVKDVRSGTTTRYRSNKPIVASDVSIQDKNIKSYQEQRISEVEKAKSSRVIYEKDSTPGGYTPKTKIQTKGRDIVLTDVPSNRKELYTSSANINEKQVDIPERNVRRYPVKNDVRKNPFPKDDFNYLLDAPGVKKTPISPRDSAGLPISSNRNYYEYTLKGDKENDTRTIRRDSFLDKSSVDNIRDTLFDRKKKEIKNAKDELKSEFIKEGGLGFAKRTASGFFKNPKQILKDLFRSASVGSQQSAFASAELAKRNRTDLITENLYSSKDKQALQTTAVVTVLSKSPKPIIYGTSAIFTTKGIMQTLKEPSPENVGETLFFATPLITKAGDTALKYSKDIYVRTGSKYVPPEDVFASEVLAGKKVMPTAKNLKTSLKEFKKSDYVSTASPSKIAGKVAGESRKSALGLEDPGIYVTPKGQGSPYFLRLSKDVPAEYSYTLNPLKGKFDIATITEFKTTGIIRQPKNVLNKPGFDATSKYLSKTGSKQTGKAFITKRSEIGQGVIKRKAGELGTSEIEAVIPPGQEFAYSPKSWLGKFKGFDKYTKFEGRNVPVRQAELIVKGKALSKGSSKISSSKIAKESDALSSLSSNVQYVSPNYSGYIPYSSQVSSSQSNKTKETGYSSTDSTSKSSQISSSAKSLMSSKSYPKISKVTSSSSTLSKISSISPVSSSTSSGSSSGGSSPVSSGGSSPISSGGSSKSSPSRSSYRSSSSGGSSYGYTPPPSKITKSLISSPWNRRKTERTKRTAGYDVYLKRFGKFKKVASRLPYNKALKKGKLESEKGLGATFEVKRRGFTSQKDIFAKPSLRNFRGYKIRAGKRIQTPLTYIQKREYRLGTIGEKREIEIAKRKKKKKSRLFI